jgi:hypothetical protein
MQQWSSAYISVSILLLLADSHTIQMTSLARIVKELTCARKCFPLHRLVHGHRKSLSNVQQYVVEGQWLEVPGAPQLRSQPYPGVTERLAINRLEVKVYRRERK